MKRWIVLVLLSLQSLALNADERHVVLIHGFKTTYRSMKPIEDSLSCADFKVWNWDYPSERRTIEQHSCALVNYLDQIARCYPGQPISFVTHSTGALILRAALNIPSCPDEAKIGRAALLAPPNKGSSLANRFRNVGPVRFLMGSKSGWQLMHYSGEDIERCFGSFPPTMQVLVVAGTKGLKILFEEENDGFVSVDETCLNTPFYWTSFPVKHGDLISCPPVLCCLRTFLYWGYPECEHVEAFPGCGSSFNYKCCYP
ncbi:MAG: alpha/beta hydrolase [Chlamydiales bacterium]|nr:alpha/beta hydrolase [Chlamydiales bacterium]